MKALRVLIAAILLGLAPASAFAQAQVETPRPFAWDIVRGVLIDPTTYAPALISYEAIRQDWRTSQVLFANGWLEENPEVHRQWQSERVPVSYDEGTSRIRRSALAILQVLGRQQCEQQSCRAPARCALSTSEETHPRALVGRADCVRLAPDLQQLGRSHQTGVHQSPPRPRVRLHPPARSAMTLGANSGPADHMRQFPRWLRNSPRARSRAREVPCDSH